MQRPTRRQLYDGLLREYRETRPDLTEYQCRQMAFAKSFEPFERFGNIRTFNCACLSCGEMKDFTAADSVRLWLNRHAGHRTWVELM